MSWTSKESTSRDRVEKLVRAKVLTAPNWGLGRDDGTSLLELGIELAIDASSGIQLWARSVLAGTGAAAMPRARAKAAARAPPAGEGDCCGSRLLVIGDDASGSFALTRPPLSSNQFS